MSFYTIAATTAGNEYWAGNSYGWPFYETAQSILPPLLAVDWLKDFPARVAWNLWGQFPPNRPRAYGLFIRPSAQRPKPRCRDPPSRDPETQKSPAAPIKGRRG